MALIHKSVHTGYDGEIFGSLNTQPVYLLSRFNQDERADIERALGISQTSTNQSIR